MPFPAPTIPASGQAEVFLRYLDYFRETVLSTRHLGHLDIVAELAGGPVGE